MDRITILAHQGNETYLIAADSRERGKAVIYLAKKKVTRVPGGAGQTFWDPIPMPEATRKHLEAAGMFIPLI